MILVGLVFVVAILFYWFWLKWYEKRIPDYYCLSCGSKNLIPVTDGLFMCSDCGKSFNPISLSKERKKHQ